MKLQARLYSMPEAVERRGVIRRTLRMDFPIIAGDQGFEASVHDLSTNGLKIQTDVALAVGDELLVELPNGQSVEARIIWQDGSTFGCQFATSITKGAVGVAVLQAPIDLDSSIGSSRIEEIEMGVGVDTDFLAQWYADFEKRRASSGEQLIGFRKYDERIIALISRLN